MEVYIKAIFIFLMKIREGLSWIFCTFAVCLQQHTTYVVRSEIETGGVVFNPQKMYSAGIFCGEASLPRAQCHISHT